MSEEFGHHGYRGDGFVMDGWGSGPFVIQVGGKSFRFGDSDRFGPYLCDKHGTPLKNEYPPERSPFWRAHRIWKKQGRRLAKDGGACIWDEVAPNKYMKIGKRARYLVESGDDDGIWIEVPFDPTLMPAP